MSARWITVGVWALVAASAVAWGLLVFVRPVPVPAGAQVADVAPPLQADLTRLLGADPAPQIETTEEPAPAPDARFALLGVVAPKATTGRSREGVALIAVDGQTPRAYRVGARIDGDTVLQSVSARGAELGPLNGPVRVALALPPPAPAATGSLPSALPHAGGFPAAARVANPVPSPVPPFARPGALRAPTSAYNPQQAGQPAPHPLQHPSQNPANAPALHDEPPDQPEAPPQRNLNPKLM